MVRDLLPWYYSEKNENIVRILQKKPNLFRTGLKLTKTNQPFHISTCDFIYLKIIKEFVVYVQLYEWPSVFVYICILYYLIVRFRS